MKQRLLIVEDVEEMRIFLESIITDPNKAGSERFEIVGLAANGWEARLAFDRKQPDWVLLDELLPGESSLDLLRDFKAQGARIVLMSGLGEDTPGRQTPVEAAGRITKPEWDAPQKRGGTVSPEAWLEALLKLVDVAK